MVFHKLRRRELAAYYFLLEAAPLNLGEALDLLSSELCMTRRVARSVVKRLRRLGLLYLEKEEAGLLVRVRGPLEVLQEDARSYMEDRRRRCWALAKRHPGEADREPG